MSRYSIIAFFLILSACKDTIVTESGRKVAVTNRYVLGGGYFWPATIEYDRTVEQNTQNNERVVKAP